ncbi:carboxynorspermidine decarboxylase [Pelagicoccus sp. SDUM812002]|uniref:carboxynorspermidine decarboxylase n=1 Tax=Pelagicoccus sp. SDUM812002 TaxID=3041266 RepID=UPI00280FCA4C|nr:carboxynorspermidine decarboxylase [Pelagicoccus sp. SDUM812002]MDQ8184523.1 carboxynorspermidine decarboxylase [Pelagicoccus sp. SDUM812002]
MDHIIHYDPELPPETPSPAYVIDLARLRSNMEIIRSVQEQSGAKILAALKGFAMHSVFPLMRDYVAGVCASGPWEAQLGAEEFGKEVHCFAPAFTEEDMQEVLQFAHHISFNSISQFQKHQTALASASREISCGLRVNPEYSEVETDIYNPCVAGSRLGIRRSALKGQDLSRVEGLHFHTMCEQNSDTLERTLVHFEEKFGDLLPQMKWVNFGGGHHITSPTYDRDRLVKILRAFKARYPHLEVYLEPGEAMAINTGVLVATVLDIIEEAPPIAVLDLSATCHMPDVLEMPYRPEIVGAAEAGAKSHTYSLGGLSCLAGDMIGHYSFGTELTPGDKLYFLDMAHYTMVKTSTFNGIKHPAIATWDPTKQELIIVRKFGYTDYRDRLS